jgi:hypothetical protein
MMMLLPFPIYVSHGTGSMMSKEAMDSWYNGGPVVKERQIKFVENMNKTNEILKKLSAKS